MSDAANEVEGGPLLLNLPWAHGIRASLGVRPRTAEQLSSMPVALRVLAVPGDRGECVFTSLLIGHKSRNPAQEPRVPCRAELIQFWSPILATIKSEARHWNDVAYRVVLERNRSRPGVEVTPAMGATALRDEVVQPLEDLCGTGGRNSGTTDLLLTIVSHVLDVDIVHMKLNVDTTPTTGTRTWSHCSLFTSRLPEADLNKTGPPAADLPGHAHQGRRRECYSGPADRSLHPLLVLTTCVTTGQDSTVAHMSPVLVQRVDPSGPMLLDHIDLATIYPPIDDGVYAHSWRRWAIVERTHQVSDNAYVPRRRTETVTLNGLAPHRGSALARQESLYGKGPTDTHRYLAPFYDTLPHGETWACDKRYDANTLSHARVLDPPREGRAVRKHAHARRTLRRRRRRRSTGSDNGSDATPSESENDGDMAPSDDSGSDPDYASPEESEGELDELEADAGVARVPSTNRGNVTTLRTLIDHPGMRMMLLDLAQGPRNRAGLAGVARLMAEPTGREDGRAAADLIRDSVVLMNELRGTALEDYAVTFGLVVVPNVAMANDKTRSVAARIAEFRSSPDAALKMISDLRALADEPPRLTHDAPGSTTTPGVIAATAFTKIQREYRRGFIQKAFAIAERSRSGEGHVKYNADVRAAMEAAHPAMLYERSCEITEELTMEEAQKLTSEGYTDHVNKLCDATFIMNNLARLKKGAAPGPFGLPADVYMSMVRKEKDEVAGRRGLVPALAELVSNIALGRMPYLAYTLLAESTIIPLQKPSGGYRAIAAPGALSKLTARCVAEAVEVKLKDVFKGLQHGVKSPAGREAATLMHRIAWEKWPDLVFASMDLRNAFNSVHRVAILRAVKRHIPEALPYVSRMLVPQGALHLPRPMQLDADEGVGAEPLWSQEGVRQGDPLSPALFALAIHDTMVTAMERLHEGGVQALITLYADDISLRGPYKAVRRFLDFVIPELRKIGLECNETKTEVIESPVAAAVVNSIIAAEQLTGPRYPHGLEATDSEGAVVLGTPIGSDAYILAKLKDAVKKVAPTRDTIVELGRAGHTNMAHTMHHMILSQKLVHLTRTVRPDLIREGLADLDTMVEDALLAIAEEGEDTIPLTDEETETARRDMHRLTDRSGLGVTSVAATAEAAHTAGLLQSLPILRDAMARGIRFGVDHLNADALATEAQNLPGFREAITESAWAVWQKRAKHRRGGVGKDEDDDDPCFMAWSRKKVLTDALRGGFHGKGTQRVLTHAALEERDDAQLEELRRLVTSMTATAADDAWYSRKLSGSPCAHLARLHGAHGRESGAWVRDTSIRKSKYGPRTGLVFAHKDAPLTDAERRTAMRIRMGLPLGRQYRNAQRMAGIPEDEPDREPRCCCSTCRLRVDGAPIGVMDKMGWHAGALTDDGYHTHRHNAITEWCRSTLRSGGTRVETEERIYSLVAGDLATDEEKRRRMDVIAYATVADVKVLASRDPMIKELSDHLLSRPELPDTDRVRLLLDHSVVHPGPHMGVLTKVASPGTLPPVDPVGDVVVKAKCAKYRATTARLSSELSDTHLVFLPLPINALGRLHPITQRVYAYFIDKAAERTRSVALIARDEHWAGTTFDPDREPWEDCQMTKFKCNKWRDLAIVLQKQLVDKVTSSMHRFCRDRCVRIAQREGAGLSGAQGRAHGSRPRGRPCNNSVVTGVNPTPSSVRRTGRPDPEG